MDGIGNKVREARKEAGLSQSELGKRVGLTQQAIAEIESGRSKKSLKIVDLAKALGKSPEWLEGQASSVPAKAKVQRADGGFPGGIVDLGGKEFAQIPVYDVRYSAGFGSQNYDETPMDYHEIGMSMLRRFTSAPVNRLAFLQVSGDSMEPLLYNYDWVLIDANQTSLVSPAIYAIAFNGEGLLKHASQNLETGAVTLVSHNPAYPPQTISRPDNLRVVGRVVLSIHTH